ncbi:MAG: T9SS type A sorting domain-containing protein, partial [Bacteroidia bacterium]|nr:T9SS type A sorting domain-containing protein [Bacteroidia bacterium]
NTLTAFQGSATYQWNQCSPLTAISGATNQVFTPSVTGSYYVVINLSGGCTDSSSCINITVTGIPNADLNNQVMIYPNPSDDGKFFIRSGFAFEAKISDISGRVIRRFNASEGQQTIVADLPPGIYFIESEDRTIKRKLIVGN